jgi:antitoxin PrlF
VSPALAERIAALTLGVTVDLDAPIDGDVDL